MLIYGINIDNMNAPSMHAESHVESLGPPQHEDLLNGRYELAVQQAESDARLALGFNQSTYANSSIDKLRDTYIAYDIGRVQASDLIAFDALGINPSELAVATRDYINEESDVLYSPTVGDETIAVRHRGNGLSLKLTVAGHETDYSRPMPATAINQKIKERYDAIPGYRALNEVKALWQDQRHLPPVIATQPFSVDGDPLGHAMFLSDIGLIDGSQIADKLRSGLSVEEISTEFKDILAFDVDEASDATRTTYTWGGAAERKLTHDKETGTYTFSVTQRPELAYAEVANQAPTVESIPFLETDAAKQLCSILDSAGLMFHPAYQLEMMRIGEAERFGSAYTQITREIAKWVDKPDRALMSKLFVPKDPAYSGTTLIENSSDFTLREYYDQTADGSAEDIESLVRKKWQDATLERTISGDAALAIVNMVDDIIGREASTEVATDLPVTNQDIKISYGACFDVASYYLFSETRPYEAENGVPMLEKLGGAHTFLTTEPLVFNGVRLPKGALMTRQDDGWAFLRLTPFSFDNSDDKMAFGSEVSKALRDPKVTSQALGSLSIARLTTKY